MHLRAPSIDHGIGSAFWGIFLGLMIWLFLLGIGISQPTSFLLAVVAACGIFLYVRLYGEDEPRRKRAR